ncbi:MAG: hypothetical protein Q8S73_04840 [Deltaproteobacteria bacterium]|nr:hypothetical protein [Myxococcales bacterium]MDP3213405.1 hypothetical protein [Deltaproteobacteria bacterium]
MAPLLAFLLLLSLGGWLRSRARAAAAERRLGVLHTRHAIVVDALGDANAVIDHCARCRRLAREVAIERHAAERFEREGAAMPGIDWHAPESAEQHAR